nr:hypothetical protein Iba_chr03fCG1120 [Ipomoea batatas]
MSEVWIGETIMINSFPVITSGLLSSLFLPPFSQFLLKTEAASQKFTAMSFKSFGFWLLLWISRSIYSFIVLSSPSMDTSSLAASTFGCKKQKLTCSARGPARRRRSTTNLRRHCFGVVFDKRSGNDVQGRWERSDGAKEEEDELDRGERRIKVVDPGSSLTVITVDDDFLDSAARSREISKPNRMPDHRKSSSIYCVITAEETSLMAAVDRREDKQPKGEGCQKITAKIVFESTASITRAEETSLVNGSCSVRLGEKIRATERSGEIALVHRFRAK